MNKALAPMILASASPRRKELLNRIGVRFEVMPLDTEEPVTGDPPEKQAQRLALHKLNAFLDTFPILRERTIMCADTCIDLDGEMVGKPADRREAQCMLERFSGRSHTVITAVLLSRGTGAPLTATAHTEVKFAPLSPRELSWYLDTREWSGVAGGYRIQEQGAVLVESIKGCYYNVMGLPIQLVYGMIRDTVPELLSGRNFRSFL
jgi:septum formation protein